MADSQEPPLNADGQPPHAPAKAAAVDKWLLRRIQEANAAALRLDKRIEALKQVETQLLKTVGVLRTSMTAAQPMAAKMEAAIGSAQKQVEEALARADTRIKNFVAQSHKTLEELPQAPDPFALRLQQHLSDHVQQRLPQNATRQEIAAVAEELQQQIMADIEAVIARRLAESVTDRSPQLEIRRIEAQLNSRAEDLLRTAQRAAG